MNILLVDDEKEVLEFLSEHVKLEIPDCTIFVAPSGDKAFEIEQKNEIHVIVSDYMMSQGNGLELLTCIRTKGRNKALPFLFFSGFLPQFADNVSYFDFVFFFEKPNDVPKIMNYLVRINKRLPHNQKKKVS